MDSTEEAESRLEPTTLFVILIVALLVLAGAWAAINRSDDNDELGGPSGPYQPLNVNATVSIGPDNEVTVAVNPLDPLNLVAGSKDYFLGETPDCGEYRVWSGYFWSFDGGLTWGNGLIEGYPGGPSSTLTGYKCNSDPVLAFDAEGNAYYSGLAYTVGSGPSGQVESAIWVARSDDGGVTYADATFVAESDTSQVFHDKQWMATDPFRPGHVYVTWSAFEYIPIADEWTARITFSRSTDYGATWTDHFVLSEWQTVSFSNQGSAPIVGADQTVSVIWFDYDRNEIRLIQNDDGGDREDWSNVRSIGSFDAAHSVPNGEYRTPTMPSFTSDMSSPASAARLYITWHDDRSGNSDILLISSFDGGTTWSEPVQVNNDETENYQFFPWVAVSPRGEVGVLFYDRRNDPEDTLLDIYLAYSSDGVNWSTNMRVTSEAFDPVHSYHQSGPNFIGDYIGLVMTDTHAYGVWCDTRNERADLYAGIIELEELRSSGM